MPDDKLEIIVAWIVLISVCAVTWESAHHTVATDCERIGAFYLHQKTFICQLKSGDTP